MAKEAVRASSCSRYTLYYFFKSLNKRNKSSLDMIFSEVKDTIPYEFFLGSLLHAKVLEENTFDFFMEKVSNCDKDDYEFFFDTLFKLYKDKGQEYLNDLKIFLYTVYLEYHFDHDCQTFSFIGIFRNPELIKMELENSYPEVFFTSSSNKFVIIKDNVENDFSKLKIDIDWKSSKSLSSIEKVDDLISGLEAYIDDEFVLNVLKEIRNLLKI